MVSKNAFIVKIPKKFKDTIKVGDKELYLDPKFDEFGNRVCHGEIVSLPLTYEGGASVGDLLFFHHHVILNDGLHLGESLYLVTYYKESGYNSHAYAYARDGAVSMIDDWVFLDAFDPSGLREENGIILMKDKEQHNNRSAVSFDSEALSELGIGKGDVVGFTKNSDYEMEVLGKRYWRMLVSDIVYKEVA